MFTAARRSSAKAANAAYCPLDATWKINAEWGLGIGASTFAGKLGGMRKMISGIDNSAPEIDLAGTTVRITGTKAF